PMTPLRVLALISDVTDPPITGTRVRNRHLWVAVAALGHEVRLLGLRQNKSESPRGPAGLRSQFFDLDREPLVMRAMHASVYSFHQWPRSKGLGSAVEATLADFKPDVIHAEELRMAAYLPQRRDAAVQTLTLHNVESELYLPVLTNAKSPGRKIR